MFMSHIIHIDLGCVIVIHPPFFPPIFTPLFIYNLGASSPLLSAASTLSDILSNMCILQILTPNLCMSQGHYIPNFTPYGQHMTH